MCYNGKDKIGLFLVLYIKSERRRFIVDDFRKMMRMTEVEGAWRKCLVWNLLRVWR